MDRPDLGAKSPPVRYRVVETIDDDGAFERTTTYTVVDIETGTKLLRYERPNGDHAPRVRHLRVTLEHVDVALGVTLVRTGSRDTDRVAEFDQEGVFVCAFGSAIRLPQGDEVVVLGHPCRDATTLCRPRCGAAGDVPSHEVRECDFCRGWRSTIAGSRSAAPTPRSSGWRSADARPADSIEAQLSTLSDVVDALHEAYSDQKTTFGISRAEVEQSYDKAVKSVGDIWVSGSSIADAQTQAGKVNPAKRNAGVRASTKVPYCPVLGSTRFGEQTEVAYRTQASRVIADSPLTRRQARTSWRIPSVGRAVAQSVRLRRIAMSQVSVPRHVHWRRFCPSDRKSQLGGAKVACVCSPWSLTQRTSRVTCARSESPPVHPAPSRPEVLLIGAVGSCEEPPSATRLLRSAARRVRAHLLPSTKARSKFHPMSSSTPRALATFHRKRPHQVVSRSTADHEKLL